MPGDEAKVHRIQGSLLVQVYVSNKWLHINHCNIMSPYSINRPAMYMYMCTLNATNHVFRKAKAQHIFKGIIMLSTNMPQANFKKIQSRLGGSAESTHQHNYTNTIWPAWLINGSCLNELT